jgi:hypothetical protein
MNGLWNGIFDIFSLYSLKIDITLFTVQQSMHKREFITIYF